MESAYLYILGAVGAGVVLGLLVPIKPLGMLVGGTIGVLLLGVLIAGVLGWMNGIWFFGLALMAATLYGSLTFGGAALSSSLRQRLHRRQARGGKGDGAVEKIDIPMDSEMPGFYQRGKNLASVAFWLLLLAVSAAFILGHRLPASVGNGLALALPFLSISAAIALLAWCWFYVKAKGRSGWWILLVPLLNIVGIWVLVLLRNDAPDER